MGFEPSRNGGGTLETHEEGPRSDRENPTTNEASKKKQGNLPWREAHYDGKKTNYDRETRYDVALKSTTMEKAHYDGALKPTTVRRRPATMEKPAMTGRRPTTMEPQVPRHRRKTRYSEKALHSGIPTHYGGKKSYYNGPKARYGGKEENDTEAKWLNDVPQTLLLEPQSIPSRRDE
ncbi:hypothetical protein BHE74_00014057 [Ensete ventricosum]|uniref:Uncharacterized protein n=1 Tax=Ensete ventricosum TaxID=4639 RepID=A0A444F533_ENSVE|nr:hypothetical protein GW17_00018319 [Ensete ventricosum]RWW77757.1 hypothetical protein BHE74_00014057 [Ensete ventricosum]RZR71379.1 hypothetical protein BHM03_00004872 [Ensete ventricosum]